MQNQACFTSKLKILAQLLTTPSPHDILAIQYTVCTSQNLNADVFLLYIRDVKTPQK